jgi:pimeloyl-ACP methyl ester carboxylesterase
MPDEGYNLHRMVADLVALLDFLRIDRTDIVGHSFGARVALAFTALHPERVRNLVIADTQLGALQPPVRLSEWPYWEEWKAQLQGHGLSDLPSDDSVINYKLLAKLSHAHGNLANEGRTRISLHTRDMGEKGLVRWEALLAGTSADREFKDESFLAPATLETITKPALLAFGKFSHCLPTAERLLDCLPNARLIIVPGAGHFFPIVRPRFFARTVEAFLMRRETSAAPFAGRRRTRRFGAGRFSV